MRKTKTDRDRWAYFFAGIAFGVFLSACMACLIGVLGG